MYSYELLLLYDLRKSSSRIYRGNQEDRASSYIPHAGIVQPSSYPCLRNFRTFYEIKFRTMSFWNESPGPNWSHFFETLVALDGNPYVLQKQSPRLPNFPYDLVTEDHCEEISLLLKTHYQTYPGSRISLTTEQIQEFLKEGWIGVMIHGTGVIFSRPLGTLGFLNKVIREEAGMVDFFCVVSSERKKGIGSRLLTALFYETSKVGRLVHLFQKEGYPLIRLPHIWTSTYCWRTVEHVQNRRIQKISSGHLPIDAPCWNTTFNVKHTDIYEYDGTFVGISDTFHTSVPDGKPIGEVVWISGKRSPIALEIIIDACEYDIVLMDSAISHDEWKWKSDARFTYYIFNAQPMRFLDVQPALTF